MSAPTYTLDSHFSPVSGPHTANYVLVHAVMCSYILLITYVALEGAYALVYICMYTSAHSVVRIGLTHNVVGTGG